MQCVADMCSRCVLQGVAVCVVVCRSALQYVAMRVEVCCSML